MIQYTKYNMIRNHAMQSVHILNPAAGQGNALKFSELDNVYITKSPGDATRYIKEFLQKNGPANFKVYGGDGTVNEAVTGIIDSGVKGASLTVVPTGTGNDLIRSIEDTGAKTLLADVLTLNDGYSVNAVNTGFDLDVVQKASQYKKRPLISGSMAYILGIVSTLMKKFGQKMKVSFTDEFGKEDSFEGDCLLALASNAKYYGGGFKSAPLADIADGLIDLLIVKKVSRLKFISLVGSYKKGLHLDPKTLLPIDKFKKFVIFKKCRKVTIDGISQICADGEIHECCRAEIDVLPQAIRIVTED